ncbi:MAG: hypothetical protein Q9227_009154 [Pyrenula ochraceoflavens]
MEVPLERLPAIYQRSQKFGPLLSKVSPESPPLRLPLWGKEKKSTQHYDCVESRLAELPSPPSSIRTSELSCQERDYSRQITPSTSNEIESNTVTASENVSLALSPQVTVLQGLYISPAMSIDDKVQKVWDQQIKDRLAVLLLHEIHSGTCVQELMMVGKKPNSLRPTIIISCGDSQTRSSVQKLAKRQKWLRNVLKDNCIMFVAVTASITLSSWLDASKARETSNEYPYAQIAGSSYSTACGLSVRVTCEDRSQRHCTLGGLLIVNGEIFGLTVGHAFKQDKMHQSIAQEAEDLLSSEVSSEDEGSDSSSLKYFLNTGNGNDESGVADTPPLNSSYGTDSRSSLAPEVPCEEDNLCTANTGPLTAWSHPLTVICSTLASNDNSIPNTPYACDWALLRHLPPTLARSHNKVKPSSSDPGALIQDIVSGSCQAEVCVIIGISDTVPGYLRSCRGSMFVEGVISEVQLVVLEQILPRGCSGAWVIDDQQLCGYIIATRQDTPWAYMIPIDAVIRDIKLQLSTEDVRLPRCEEFNAANISTEACGSMIYDESSPEAGSYQNSRTMHVSPESCPNSQNEAELRDRGCLENESSRMLEPEQLNSHNSQLYRTEGRPERSNSLRSELPRSHPNPAIADLLVITPVRSHSRDPVPDRRDPDEQSTSDDPKESTTEELPEVLPFELDDSKRLKGFKLYATMFSVMLTTFLVGQDASVVFNVSSQSFLTIFVDGGGDHHNESDDNYDNDEYAHD